MSLERYLPLTMIFSNDAPAFQVMDVVSDLNGVQIAYDTEVIGQKMVSLAQSKLDDAGFADWLRQQAKQSAESSGE